MTKQLTTKMAITAIMQHGKIAEEIHRIASELASVAF